MNQMHPKMRQRVLEVKGLKAFGDVNLFSLWTYLPCETMGNKPPISLMETSKGFEQVIAELDRISSAA